MNLPEFIFGFSLAGLFYVFGGYPVLLLMIGWFIPKKTVIKGPIQPKVSLIISAYNEERVIKAKIENSLSLDYPDEKLEIIVVSDASTDKTDSIVAFYANKGVVLRRMEKRNGKTAGLNEAIPLARGEIIVFTDANAMFASDSIQRLVENFSDPTVGCVTGDSRYVGVEESSVGKMEDTYWSGERFLKIKETQIGSMVGSDGAIFAIKSNLFSPLHLDDINDFVTPLQIVSLGYRCIFEPGAICYEGAMARYREEFRRKMRIVNRSLYGLFRVKSLLNPFRYGWFSFQLLSHKLLRWLTSFFLVFLLVSNMFLFVEGKGSFYAVTLSGQFLFYFLGIAGLFLENSRKWPNFLSLPSYFLVVNVASLLGILKCLFGQRIRMWEPEREG